MYYNLHMLCVQDGKLNFLDSLTVYAQINIGFCLIQNHHLAYWVRRQIATYEISQKFEMAR